MTRTAKTPDYWKKIFQRRARLSRRAVTRPSRTKPFDSDSDSDSASASAFHIGRPSPATFSIGADSTLGTSRPFSLSLPSSFVQTLSPRSFLSRALFLQNPPLSPAAPSASEEASFPPFPLAFPRGGALAPPASRRARRLWTRTRRRRAPRAMALRMAR